MTRLKFSAPALADDTELKIASPARDVSTAVFTDQSTALQTFKHNAMLSKLKLASTIVERNMLSESSPTSIATWTCIE